MLHWPKIPWQSSLYRSFVTAPDIFINPSDDCFISPPIPSIRFTLSFPYTTPCLPPPIPCQALEGAPSDQLMQQSQIPKYYAQQPWVPTTSVSSLSPLFHSSSSISSFLSSTSSCTAHHPNPTQPFISLHQCGLPLLAGVSSLRGLSLLLHSLHFRNRIPQTHGQCNRAAQNQKVTCFPKACALFLFSSTGNVSLAILELDIFHSWSCSTSVQQCSMSTCLGDKSSHFENHYNV